jgi:hypothetical protein
MRVWTTVCLPFSLVLLLGPTGASAQAKINRDQSTYTNLRDEGYPVRTGLEIVAADDAELRDDDMILGVVIGKRARAYPVNLMWEPENEVLNDTLGGAAITATW